MGGGKLTSGIAINKLNADPLRYDAANEHPAEVGGMMRKHMPEGVRVLDVGCGTGSITAVANRGKGNTVIGLEPDPTRAALARSRGFEVHEELLTSEFVERAGRFDVIVFADVLEHIPDPQKTLNIAISALKPGGLILTSVPNVAHITVRLMLLFGRWEYQQVGIMDATHLRWFTAKTYRRFIESSGLDIEAFHHTAGVYTPSYSGLSIKRAVNRIRRLVIGSLVAILPGLFGFQHFVVARAPLNINPAESVNR